MSEPDAPFGGRRYNPNTPEGQIESAGAFARGLGARRIRIALLVAAIVVAIAAVLSAVL